MENRGVGKRDPQRRLIETLEHPHLTPVSSLPLIFRFGTTFCETSRVTSTVAVYAEGFRGEWGGEELVAGGVDRPAGWHYGSSSNQGRA